MLKEQQDVNTQQAARIRTLETEATRMKKKLDHISRECNRLESEKRKYKTIQGHLTEMLEKKNTELVRKRSRNE